MGVARRQRALSVAGLAGTKILRLDWFTVVVHRGCRGARALTTRRQRALFKMAEANGPIDVIVGVGINYELPATTRQQIDQPATDLLQHMSKRHSRNDILAALLSELFELFMNNDEQRETLLDEWRRYDCYKDKMARLLLPAAEVSGQLKGIDEDGCLLMSVNGQIQRFSCGEISLRVQA